MKCNLFFALAVGLVFWASNVSALSTELVTRLGSPGSPAGTFYTQWGGWTVVTGLSLHIPAQVQSQVTTDIDLGVVVNPPVFGQMDLMVRFNKLADPNSKFRMETISLAKNVLYDLTDELKFGVRIQFLSLNLNAGSRGLHVLTAIQPALGMRLDLK